MSKPYDISFIDEVGVKVYNKLRSIITDQDKLSLMQSLTFSNSSIMAVQNSQNTIGQKKQRDRARYLNDDSHNDQQLKPTQVIQKELNKLTQKTYEFIGENITLIKDMVNDVKLSDIADVIINNGIIDDENSYQRKNLHLSNQLLLSFLSKRSPELKEAIKKETYNKFNELLNINYIESRKYEALGCWIGNLVVVGYITTKEYFNLLYEFIVKFENKKSFACSAIMSSLFVSGEKLDEALICETNYFYRYLIDNKDEQKGFLQCTILDLLAERNRDITISKPKDKNNSVLEQKQKTNEIKKPTIDVATIMENFEKYFNDYINGKELKFVFNDNIQSVWNVLNSMLINCQNEYQKWEEFCSLFLKNYDNIFLPENPSTFFEKELLDLYKIEYSPLNLTKLLLVFVYYSFKNNQINVLSKCIEVINYIIKEQKDMSKVTPWQSLVKCVLNQEIYWEIPIEITINITKEIYLNIQEFNDGTSIHSFCELLRWFIYLTSIDQEKTVNDFFQLAVKDNMYDSLFYLALYLYYCIPENEDQNLFINPEQLTLLNTKYEKIFQSLIEVMFESYPEDLIIIKNDIIGSD